MTEFEDRERAFEKKFEIDQELRFKTLSHGAHLFGIGVAEKMGLKGPEARAYAKKAVNAMLQKGGREQIIAKAEKDLQAKGLRYSYHMLEKEFGACSQAARAQIIAQSGL